MGNIAILFGSLAIGIVACTRLASPEDDFLFIIAIAISLIGIAMAGAGIVTGQDFFEM